MNTLQICRVCMQNVNNSSGEDMNLEEHLNIWKKLRYSIPELDLTIIPNPKICSDCSKTVDIVYNFKNRCFQTEIKISKYLQAKQTLNEANFTEIIHFNNLQTMKIKTEFLRVKEEPKDDIGLLTCNSDPSSEDELGIPVNAEEGDHSVMKTPCVWVKSEKVDTDYDVCVAEENLPSGISGNSENSFTSINVKQQNCVSSTSKTNRVSYLKTLKKAILNNRQAGKNYYKCSICDYFTNFKSLFDVHKRIHLKEGDVPNNLVTFEFNKSPMSVKNEDESDFDAGTTSEIKILDSSDSEERDENEKRFKCSYCDYQCRRKQNLLRHTRTHTGEKQFSCSYCDYRSNYKQSLIRHIRVHTGETPFQCTYCDYRCKDKQGLILHIRTHTGEKSFKCSYCDYRCNRRSHLISHMMNHTGLKTYKCSLCNYQGNYKHALKRHMSTHEADKHFKCSICDYQCSRNSQLTRHMLKHSQKNLFECSVCEYKSNCKESLTRHMRTHIKDKPFKCTLCSYQCNRNSQLTHHMMDHTGIKPFKCTYCNYECKNKKYFMSHMNVHEDEEISKANLSSKECV